MTRLLLASASPRRRELLTVLQIPFEPLAVDVDERALADEASAELAERLARTKAAAGARLRPGWLAIGADTVVALDGQSLGKPSDAADAWTMLRALRGRRHEVITAVAVGQSEGDTSTLRSRVVATSVWMRDYTDEEIESYISSGDPFDKAGAYAIQHAGFHPVERVDGCFLTVVGLPLPELCELLEESGGGSLIVGASALASVCPACIDRERLGSPVKA